MTEIFDLASVLLTKLRRIPDTVRDFSVSVSDARRHYYLTPELLDQLMAMGLPHRGTGDAIRFDLVDVMNLALHLGSSPPARAARRFWAA
ncbi:MAG TPA: hypothetical protein VGB74_17185, partial [Actinoplanes sp.]